MQQEPEQPPDRSNQSPFPGAAVEGHGRTVTANAQAAAFYRQAQNAIDATHVVEALRLAVKADAAFGLAIADLDAITQAPPSPTIGRHTNWERHHIEVVRTAAAGNVDRAIDLLREHLASVGCDPLALRIVTDLRHRTGTPAGSKT